MESGYRMAAATSTLRILGLLESVTEFDPNHSRSVDLFEGLHGAGSHADGPATALIVQQLGFVMIYTAQDRKQDISLSNAYTLNVTEAPTITVAKVLTANGEIASIGRVVFVDDFAIYDRIETHHDHRRRGLASAVMNGLQSAARVRGNTRGVLVATADGHALYKTLGWRLHSLYTTAVIPGPTLLV
jgi:GNAT superfamily N-acetyltransferase